MSTSDRPATLCEAFQRTAADRSRRRCAATPWRHTDLDLARVRRTGSPGRGRPGRSRRPARRHGVADDGQPRRVLSARGGRTTRRRHLVLRLQHPARRAVGVPVRQRRHQGGDVRGAVCRADPCQRGRHRAHRLPRRLARGHAVGRRPHRRRCRRLRLRVLLAGSATRRRGHADLHVGHHRQSQGCGDDPRQPAVPGVRGRRGARRASSATGPRRSCRRRTSPTGWARCTSRRCSAPRSPPCSDARAIAAALPDVRPTIWGAVPRVWEKLKAAIEFAAANEPDETKRMGLQWGAGGGREEGRGAGRR